MNQQNFSSYLILLHFIFKKSQFKKKFEFYPIRKFEYGNCIAKNLQLNNVFISIRRGFVLIMQIKIFDYMEKIFRFTKTLNLQNGPDQARSKKC